MKLIVEEPDTMSRKTLKEALESRGERFIGYVGLEFQDKTRGLLLALSYCSSEYRAFTGEADGNGYHYFDGFDDVWKWAKTCRVKLYIFSSRQEYFQWLADGKDS